MKLIEFIRDECPRLRFRGLMSMGAIGDTEEFEAIQKLKSEAIEEFKDTIIPEDEFILSMGTSSDYE